MLAPLDVFARTLAAETLIALLPWAGLAILINVGLVVVVFLLDANYLEASLATSQKLYRKFQQMRRSGMVFRAGSKGAKRSLPRFPRWWGVGPIAWKQLTGVWRRSRSLLLVIGIAVVVAVFSLGSAGMMNSSSVIIVLVMPTVLFVQSMPFDFRGDVDHMDWLKGLPIHPLALSVGQLLVPVALLTGVHLLITVCLWAYLGPGTVPWPVIPFLVPGNLLVIGLENLVFLLFPVRLVAATPGDLEHFGRNVLLGFLKLLLVAVVGLFAGLAGGLVYIVSGSLAAALVVAWVMVAALAVSMVLLVSWAYLRFDVSTDVPA